MVRCGKEAIIGPKLLGALGAILLVVLFPLTLGYWWSEGHGMALSRAARIKTGMSRAQDQRIAGRPGTDNGRSWVYSRVTFCMVSVHFDGAGKVIEVVHDH